MLSAVYYLAVFMNCRSVNDYWSALYKVMWDAISINVPKSSHHSAIRMHDLAILRHVRATILRKRKAWKKWRHMPTDGNKIAYN